MAIAHKIDTYKDMLKISTYSVNKQDSFISVIKEHFNNIDFFEELVNSKNKYIFDIRDCRLDKKNKDIELIYELIEKNKNKINNIKEEFKKKLMEENIQI
jgi:translation initiation factor IF-2